HALIARLLNLKVNDLFQLMSLSKIPKSHLATLDDLLTLASMYDWFQGSGYALDDLGMMTSGQVGNPSRYPDKNAAAANLVSGVAKDHALEFADTVFAFSPGITEAQSQQIIKANPSLFEAVPNSSTGALRLTTAFKLGVSITIPAGIALASADAGKALL